MDLVPVCFQCQWSTISARSLFSRSSARAARYDVLPVALRGKVSRPPMLLLHTEQGSLGRPSHLTIEVSPRSDENAIPIRLVSLPTEDKGFRRFLPRSSPLKPRTGQAAQQVCLSPQPGDCPVPSLCPHPCSVRPLRLRNRRRVRASGPCQPRRPRRSQSAAKGSPILPMLVASAIAHRPHALVAWLANRKKPMIN
jgi:hypothetical protein